MTTENRRNIFAFALSLPLAAAVYFGYAAGLTTLFYG